MVNKKIDFTPIVNIVSEILLMAILIIFGVDIYKLQDKVDTLNGNQIVILEQIQESEKEISTLDKVINKYSREFGVDKNLVKAISIVESGGNLNAKNSSSGAVGVMQIMPRTGKAMGENIYNPEGNIRAGVKYLAYLHKKFDGDTDKVLAGYNAGEGNVKKYNGVPPFKETKSYVKKVKTEKAKLDNATK